ncbi:hypothetical protein D3C80_1556900 [compost metagenome]
MVLKVNNQLLFRQAHDRPLAEQVLDPLKFLLVDLVEDLLYFSLALLSNTREVRIFFRASAQHELSEAAVERFILTNQGNDLA